MKIAKWDTFQGYSKTGPRWIKLHAGLIDKPEWMRLPLVAKAVLPTLWIAASRSGSDGALPDDIETLAMLCHMKQGEVLEALEPLVSAGFITCDKKFANSAKELSHASRQNIGLVEESRVEESREREHTETAGGSASETIHEAAIRLAADADIDRIDKERAFEEGRFNNLAVAVKNRGFDIQAVLDSLPRPKNVGAFSASRWLATGMTGIGRSEPAITRLKLTNDGLEAWVRSHKKAEKVVYASEVLRKARTA